MAKRQVQSQSEISQTAANVGANASNPAPAKKSLSDLKEAATSKPKAKKPSGDENLWVIPLTPEAEADAVRWSGSKAVHEDVQQRMDGSKNAFVPYALRKIVERMVETGSKPANPLVQVEHNEIGRAHV